MFKVKISPTRIIKILGLEKRHPDKMAWCAVTAGINRLFWVDGYLLCLEVYEQSFDYELQKEAFPISQLCYAEMPGYIQVYDLGRGTQLPVVDVSDMRIYQAIVKTIRKTNTKR
jgi:hypothetical protein